MRTFAALASSRRHKTCLVRNSLRGWAEVAWRTTSMLQAASEVEERYRKRLMGCAIKAMHSNVGRSERLMTLVGACRRSCVRRAMAFWGEALTAKKRAACADFKAAGLLLRSVRRMWHSWQEMSLTSVRLLGGMRKLEDQRLWHMQQQSFCSWKHTAAARWDG
jgi:hypothetical protein